VRVFFALWPDSSTTERIAQAADGLNLPDDARVVPRENYHATLIFVGEVAESMLGALQRIGAARSARHCIINFDTLEYWRESRVVVAAAREVPSALRELCGELQRALLLEGLIESVDARSTPRAASPSAPLRLHVTLARRVAQGPVLKEMSPFSWSAQAFSLVRSDAGGAQSVYTVVDTWPLLYESPQR
jgi:2'-5' RNA ligase